MPFWAYNNFGCVLKLSHRCGESYYMYFLAFIFSREKDFLRILIIQTEHHLLKRKCICCLKLRNDLSKAVFDYVRSTPSFLTFVHLMSLSIHIDRWYIFWLHAYNTWEIKGSRNKSVSKGIFQKFYHNLFECPPLVHIL